MATVLPIKFGALGSCGRETNSVNAGPAASALGRQACSLGNLTVSAISTVAGLMPVLTPVVIGLLVFT